MKSAKSIVYVTRDIERANSLSESENYTIVSNEKGAKLDTYELLQAERVEKIMKEKKDAAIIVFQDTARIERLCTEKKWKILNPSAELSKKIEEKISQYEWLGDLRKFLPPTEIKKMSEIKFGGKPLVVQFNHGHTGLGTKIIKNENELKELSAKFPDRPARVSDFIDGPVFTLNTVVAKNGVFCGNISYQITGLPEFTDNPFSTIGNDWKLPNKILSEKEEGQILEMARAIGARLSSEKWLGLFGIDVILDEKSRKIYLLEINARQPASTTCESILQKSAGKDMTTFEAHIAALLGEKVAEIQKISDGAQIVQREKGTAKEISRVRFNEGIMESHGKLNSVGKEIASKISKK